MRPVTAAGLRGSASFRNSVAARGDPLFSWQQGSFGSAALGNQTNAAIARKGKPFIPNECPDGLEIGSLLDSGLPDECIIRCGW
jgi:hypothetical protein